MANTSNLPINNIFQWIVEQPSSFIDRIYGERENLAFNMLDEALSGDSNQNSSLYSCRAMFQSLSMLGKVYTSRLVFLNSIHVDDMAAWTKDQTDHANTVVELQKYRILICDEVIDGISVPKDYKVNPYFKSNFIRGLSNPSEPWHGVIQKTENVPEYFPGDLEIAAIEKWNVILRFLLNLPLASGSVEPSMSIKTVLKKHMILLTENNQLTSRGYEFMLNDYYSQTWQLIWTIIEKLPNQEESISFLFMLAFCVPRKAYPVKTLTKTQKQLVVACNEIGVLLIDKNFPYIFYPSRFAVNLIFKAYSHNRGNAHSSESELPASLVEKAISFTKLHELRIIVETNMQVVAYVNSDLHVALLKLFIDVNIRMPNMVMGKITREKAKEAFKVGISVAQMVDFLSSHSHEVVNKASERSRLSVPDNVVDQLVLWQEENRRIKECDAEVITFDPNQITPSMFQEFVAYAQRLDACLWVDKSKMIMAVTIPGYESLLSIIGNHSSGDYL